MMTYQAVQCKRADEKVLETRLKRSLSMKGRWSLFYGVKHIAPALVAVATCLIGSSAMAAESSATLTLAGEAIRFSEKNGYTHRYTCGAVATYTYEKDDMFGTFFLDFDGDTTITNAAGGYKNSSGYCIRTTQSLQIHLNGHNVQCKGRAYSDGSISVYGGVLSRMNLDP